MAGNPNRLEAKQVDNEWIRDEPTISISAFALEGSAEIPFANMGPSENWEVVVPDISDCICSRYTKNCIPMYEVVFKELGFLLPFTRFVSQVFQWLELAPEQLHPNMFPFIRAFELICEHLGLTPTIYFFFAIFALQRGPERYGCKSWVSFCQPK